MSWSARLMAVRALGPGGGSDADVAAAFDYAGDNGRPRRQRLARRPGRLDHAGAARSPPPEHAVRGGGRQRRREHRRAPRRGEFPCNYHRRQPDLRRRDDPERRHAELLELRRDVGRPRRARHERPLGRAGPRRRRVQRRLRDQRLRRALGRARRAGRRAGVGRGRARRAASGAFSIADSPGGNYANNGSPMRTCATPARISSGVHGCVLSFDARDRPRVRRRVRRRPLGRRRRELPARSWRRRARPAAPTGSFDARPERRRPADRDRRLRDRDERDRHRGRAQRRRRRRQLHPARAGRRRLRVRSTAPRWRRRTSPAPRRCCSAASRR